ASHCACLSRVARDCGVRSDESDSKKTRSPTFTTKSCWLPGGAAPAPPTPAPSSFTLLAQAAAASAATRATANLAVRTRRMTFGMRLLLLAVGAGMVSSRDHGPQP